MSDDGLSYTFTLREGLMFNDGAPVTGDDVKGTFLRMLDPEAAFQVSGTAYYDAIEGVPSTRRARPRTSRASRSTATTSPSR